MFPVEAFERTIGKFVAFAVKERRLHLSLQIIATIIKTHAIVSMLRAYQIAATFKCSRHS